MFVQPDESSLDFSSCILRHGIRNAKELACGVCLLNVDSRSKVGGVQPRPRDLGTAAGGGLSWLLEAVPHPLTSPVALNILQGVKGRMVGRLFGWVGEPRAPHLGGASKRPGCSAPVVLLLLPGPRAQSVERDLQQRQAVQMRPMAQILSSEAFDARESLCCSGSTSWGLWRGRAQFGSVKEARASHPHVDSV